MLTPDYALAARVRLLSEAGPWFITEDGIAALVTCAVGFDEQPEAARRAAVGKGSTAVLPVMGALSHRAGFWGGTSYQGLTSQLGALSANADVSTIILDVDSPGGSVAGLDEFAHAVAAVPQRTIAVANTLMASAAYFIAASADEIVAAPSALVGSIGTVATHINLAGMLEKFGVEVTMISAGKGKTDGNPFEPLSEEARADEQALVDTFYGQFVEQVVRGRNAAGQRITGNTVRDKWQAKIYTAEEARERGLVDRVGTIGETVAATIGRRSDGRRAARERARRRLALA